MRHLISLKEQSKKDLLDIISIAQDIKGQWENGEITSYLPNKTLVMLFEKTSTRTRLSFEAGMTELGGHAIFLDVRTTQLSLGTDFKDEIQAIMRYGDVLMYRALKADSVELAASFDRIPVIDACSEKYHPAQALGDLLTMIEHAQGIENIKKVTWLGIENNVSNSLMLVCTKLGIKFTLCVGGVDEASLDPELNKQAEKTGLVERVKDIADAVKDADFVHTDTWLNMEYFENGEVKSEFKKMYEQRKRQYLAYQLSAKLINENAPRAKIMHCMPCHIGYEITRDAVDHPNSIIFEQAENRKHVQKGILYWLAQQK